MKEAISIVIPVFNVKEYLPDCLESLLGQTFEMWNAILIDDGSTDGSDEICERYCTVDKRFHYYRQENAGVSVARNVGKEKCTGKYTFFMDADDTILSNTLEDIYNVAEREKADLVSFQFQKVSNNSEIENVDSPIINQVCNTQEAMDLFLREQKIGISMCTKLVKNSIIKDIEFEIGRKANEDKFFLFETLLRTSKVVILNSKYYCYWTRQNSATTRPFDERWFDCVYFAQKIYTIISTENPELEPQARYQLLSVSYFLLRQMDIELLYALTVVTILAYVTEGPVHPLYYIYTLTVKNRVPCIITLLGGVLNVVGMFVLVRYTNMGIYSIVITTTIITTITSMITNPPYIAHCLKLKWYTFYPMLLINIIGSVIMTVLFGFVAKAIAPSTWVGLIVTACILSILGFGIYFIFVFSNKERKYIINMVKRKANIKQ